MIEVEAKFAISDEAAFRRTLASHLASDRPFALVTLDLDAFKHVNDRLGHETGDNVLREVGGRLRDFFGGANGVARLGGDEFAALVPLDRPLRHARLLRAGR